ncbi:MAG: small multi-drug export protein [Candidatus Bathyarchaeia archaeon]|nr:hypothetical protein [Candidatus Bathyarchaeota archaeon]
MPGVYHALRGLLARHARILAAVILVGLTLGILRTRWAVFITLSLAGGFPLAILYGGRIGLPPFISCIFVVALDLALAFTALTILRGLGEYWSRRCGRVGSYLERLRSRYIPLARGGGSSRLRGLSTAGLMILATMFVGWWLPVVISYLLNLELRRALKLIALGLALGGVFAWALYSGLAVAIPNPMLLTVALLGIFTGLAQMLERAMGRGKTL